MTVHFQLPNDPLSRFLEIYEELNSDRGWFQSAAPLRFSAMSAMTCPGDARSVAAEIRRLGEEIKEESGWFGALNSELRFIVASMLLVNADTARGLLAEVQRVQALFREQGIRRGSIYETMAILVMRMQAEGRRVEVATVKRFHAIYEEMKRHHWWLTGPDDFPACAILTGRPESVSQIGSTIERIYQALASAGFSKGDPLQTAANLLFLAKGEPAEIAHRYRGISDGFKKAGVAIWQSDYDELAILSFLDHSAKVIVDRVVSNREEMGKLRPKPDHLLTFNLAASIAFAELVQVDTNLKTITDAKSLMDMQAIIQAQQAAATAAATSAAVAASSSSS